MINKTKFKDINKIMIILREVKLSNINNHKN